MNRFGSFFRPLTWITPLLLAALVAGCGEGGGKQTAGPVNAAAAARHHWARSRASRFWVARR